MSAMIALANVALRHARFDNGPVLLRHQKRKHFELPRARAIALVGTDVVRDAVLANLPRHGRRVGIQCVWRWIAEYREEAGPAFAQRAIGQAQLVEVAVRHGQRQLASHQGRRIGSFKRQ
jgi:hypothetical protein